VNESFLRLCGCRIITITVAMINRMTKANAVRENQSLVTNRLVEAFDTRMLRVNSWTTANN